MIEKLDKQILKNRFDNIYNCLNRLHINDYTRIFESIDMLFSQVESVLDNESGVSIEKPIVLNSLLSGELIKNFEYSILDYCCNNNLEEILEIEFMDELLDIYSNKTLLGQRIVEVLFDKSEYKQSHPDDVDYFDGFINKAPISDLSILYKILETSEDLKDRYIKLGGLYFNNILQQEIMDLVKEVENKKELNTNQI